MLAIQRDQCKHMSGRGCSDNGIWDVQTWVPFPEVFTGAIGDSRIHIVHEKAGEKPIRKVFLFRMHAGSDLQSRHG